MKIFSNLRRLSSYEKATWFADQLLGIENPGVNQTERQQRDGKQASKRFSTRNRKDEERPRKGWAHMGIVLGRSLKGVC